MEKTGFYGYVYDFSIDYDPIIADYITNIHKYLIKTWYIINKMFIFIKKCFFIAMTFFSCNALTCFSINNQQCKISNII